MSPSLPAADAEPKVPVWKNPFVVAFVMGAVVLTVLPLLQRVFLKAPPPLRQLTSWELGSLGGGAVSSEALAGHVVLLTFENGPCDDGCLGRQRDFGTATRHVDDLKHPVTLVTLAGPSARDGLAPLTEAATPAWRFAAADAQLTVQLQAALDAFLPPPGANFAASGGIALIDQNNAVRGFWNGDIVGRGNSINAARLLAKEGPTP